MSESVEAGFSDQTLQELFEEALHARGSPPPPAPPDFWESDDFPYHVESFAGRGASGFVWKAVPHAGGTPVALKLIPFHGGSEILRYRWAIEISALERLVHPNLVRLLDNGLAPDSSAGWLALEWIEGSSLADVLRDQTRIPWRSAIDLALQACEALAAIHDSGHVHRDIKPANLLIEKSTGRLVVADLGISLDLGKDNDLRLTRTFERAATPGYAPPEQFTANYSPAPTDDQYSLAVTLWETITGTRPAGAFPRLQTVSQAPASLDRVLRRALDPDPARRFPSIFAFAKALRRSTTWHASVWPYLRFFLLIALLAAATSLAAKHFNGNSPLSQQQAPSFPMRFRSGKLVVPGAEKAYMAADMTLSRDGHFRGYVHTYTEDNLRGFTGFIIIAFRDPEKNIIWQYWSPDYGVNGKWIPGQKPARTDEWSIMVPPEIVPHVASADFLASIASRSWKDRFHENQQDFSKGIHNLLSRDAPVSSPGPK